MAAWTTDRHFSLGSSARDLTTDVLPNLNVQINETFEFRSDAVDFVIINAASFLTTLDLGEASPVTKFQK